MSAYFGTEDQIADIGSFVINGANTITFAPGRPIDVKRIIFVTTTANTTAANNCTFGVRNVDDTSSTQVGSFSTPAAMALNSVFDADVAGVKSAVTGSDASQPSDVTLGRVLGRQESLPGVVEVNPGQEFWITSDGGGTAGVVQVYLEYIEMGNNPQRFTSTDMAVTFS